MSEQNIKLAMINTSINIKEKNDEIISNLNKDIINKDHEISHLYQLNKNLKQEKEQLIANFTQLKQQNDNLQLQINKLNKETMNDIFNTLDTIKKTKEKDIKQEIDHKRPTTLSTKINLTRDSPYHHINYQQKLPTELTLKIKKLKKKALDIVAETTANN